METTDFDELVLGAVKPFQVTELFPEQEQGFILTWSGADAGVAVETESGHGMQDRALCGGQGME